MPIVHVHVWKGFGEQKAKSVIQKITKVFVDLGIPENAVEVIVHEIPKSHWGIGGEPALKKFKDNQWCLKLLFMIFVVLRKLLISVKGSVKKCCGKLTQFFDDSNYKKLVLME